MNHWVFLLWILWVHFPDYSAILQQDAGFVLVILVYSQCGVSQGLNTSSNTDLLLSSFDTNSLWLGADWLESGLLIKGESCRDRCRWSMRLLTEIELTSLWPWCLWLRERPPEVKTWNNNNNLEGGHLIMSYSASWGFSSEYGWKYGAVFSVNSSWP